MIKIALLMSILGPLVLLSSMAEAKKDRAPPFAAESFSNAAPLVTGAVKQFVINPYGEIDGLLLEDGTLAKYPPHMAGELAAAVKPGDTISVRGIREYAGTVNALLITNE